MSKKIILFFRVVLQSCCLALCILLGSKFYRNTLFQTSEQGSSMESIPKVSFFCLPKPGTEDEPSCFILKPLESTVWAISPFRLVSIVVSFSVPCDQVHGDFIVLLLSCSSFATHSLESSSLINAYLQPFPFIHVSFLFSSSHSRQCSLICASDFPTTGSGPIIACSVPNFSKSSTISLVLIFLYPGREQLHSSFFSRAI